MSENKDTLKNIVGVALGVCLVCSILVAAAAVVLKPRQERNKILEKRKNVLLAGGLIKEKEKADYDGIFAAKIEPMLIDLKTGGKLPADEMKGLLTPDAFDIKKVAKTPGLSEDVPKKTYKAKLKKVPTKVLVYKVKENGAVVAVIMPLYGKGLWSTMYGFIAVNKDLKTVRGFTFYEHGETPGLGGEVDNAKWKAAWKGKLFYDEAGKLQVEVIKRIAPPGSKTEVDGLSGATLTTRGIDNMLKFWFGEKGYYRPFLNKINTHLQ